MGLPSYPIFSYASSLSLGQKRPHQFVAEMKISSYKTKETSWPPRINFILNSYYGVTDQAVDLDNFFSLLVCAERERKCALTPESTSSGGHKKRLDKLMVIYT